MESKKYPKAQKGASLVLAFRPQVTLIIGSGQLAATRAFSALEAYSSVVVFAKEKRENIHEELLYREQTSELVLRTATSEETELATIEALLDNEGRGKVSLVFVTDTLSGLDNTCRRSTGSARLIHHVCRRRGIPVNVADMPDLCDFTVCATHRFADVEGKATPLQLGITTNGKGCRLSSRLKRELVAKMPLECGAAVEKVGRLRNLAKSSLLENTEELNEENISPSPNHPVAPQNYVVDEGDVERARRRMKWVAQISEYWPISRLAALNDVDMADLLSAESLASKFVLSNAPPKHLISQHGLDLSPSSAQGCVLLVGSGPGHPSLLTLAAHHALTSAADLVLTDKLVPEGVLSLIPSHVEVRVARKFPGNADGAQQELMEMALTAAREGRTVVRLKQGDPAMYGRVGEELLFFRSHGVHALIIPGVSSALAAPLFADIPVTQRGAADSLSVCTGVGRGGGPALLPGYARSRTLVVLMGNARLNSVVQTLLTGGSEEGPKCPYPPYTPASIVERASMPDQRVIRATLSDIVEALNASGEQRPPGLLVVGWAVLSLSEEGDTSILGSVSDEAKDKERIRKWLGGQTRKVSEGIDPLWSIFSG